MPENWVPTPSSRRTEANPNPWLLSGAEFARISELNRRYRSKFGFPCIVALKLHASRASVLAEMERRLGNSAEQELASALEQIGHITRGRLANMFGEG